MIEKGLSGKILLDFLMGVFSLKAILKTVLFGATLYGGGSGSYGLC